MSSHELLLANAASTWALVGLIWTIQLVQYPGFLHVGRSEFSQFHEHHCNRIVWIVAPLMGLELMTAALIVWQRPPSISPAFATVGLGLTLAIWAATVLLSVPLHARVRWSTRGVQRALVRFNWIRTCLWSARGAWAVIALQGAFLQ